MLKSELERYYSRAARALHKYKAIRKRLPIDADACAEHLYMDTKTEKLSCSQRELMQRACVYAVTDYINSLDYALIIMNAANDPKHYLDGTPTQNCVTASESGDAVIKYNRYVIRMCI
jgi:hypothetical protein